MTNDSLFDARRDGREGMVTVVDYEGRIVGSMGVETWAKVLAEGDSGSPFDPVRHALNRLIARGRTADIPDPEWQSFWDERAKRPQSEYRFDDSKTNGGC